MYRKKIAVVGLGYVGGPLACLFAKKYDVVGYDVNEHRVQKLNAGTYETEEIGAAKLATALQNGMRCTTDPAMLADRDVIIVSVPTPIDKSNRSDLTPVIEATRTVGRNMKEGAVVIYESTVYPGVTEEVCVPVLEKESGLEYNRQFFVGYSPERINPADPAHTVENILKITSGSTPEIALAVDELYNSVLLNGTYRAASIKVAEAAKIIENSQRDVNIAFINETAQVLNAMGISANEVIDAASTKWNFIQCRPGLVGGHCIGVDPYYLIERAEAFGVKPRLMKEARHINNNMSGYIADTVVKHLNKLHKPVYATSILILGFTFKKNCHDIRNTKVADLYSKLKNYTPYVDVLDPFADARQSADEYGIEVHGDPAFLKGRKYGAIIIAVEHDNFESLDYEQLLEENGFVYTITSPKIDADLETGSQLIIL